MDETLTGPTQPVKTQQDKTLSWKSKFKHFDLQHLNINNNGRLLPTYIFCWS